MSKDNRKTVLQQFSQVVYVCNADTAAEKFQDLLAVDDNNSRLHDHMSKARRVVHGISGECGQQRS